MWPVKLTLVILLCYTVQGENVIEERDLLHNGISTGIGNFSLELLYHTSNAAINKNLIISPVSVWTTMTVIAEGSTRETYKQIKKALRLPSREKTRQEFIRLFKYLVDNTTTITLETVNTIFLDNNYPLEANYKDLIQKLYQVRAVNVNFLESENTANLINKYINMATHEKIPKLVQPSDLTQSKMILTSALYFKGQWEQPFNRSSTFKVPFYDSIGKKTGEVNMMYARAVYPFANMKDIQARVIEIPYGKEKRLSMLIMLPYNNVSVDQMFRNFIKLTLDDVFKTLKRAAEEYIDDEVDLFLPRFKITSDVVLNKPLIDMGIHNVFDETLANMSLMTKSNIYLTSVIHKASIEVTEEGTEAAAVSSADFANRISISKFEANHPFAYMIIEKTTNAIVFGGIYETPELY